MSFNRPDRADLAIKSSFFLVVVVMLIGALVPQLERWEPYWFPVVDDFRILSTETQDDQVILSGDMRKLRACEFLSLTFYAGDPDDPDALRERLYVEFLDQSSDASTTRVEGRQAWGPWRLSKPRTTTGPQVFMRVNHRCHPFWNTSKVYASIATERLFPRACGTGAAAPNSLSTCFGMSEPLDVP